MVVRRFMVLVEKSADTATPGPVPVQRDAGIRFHQAIATGGGLGGAALPYLGQDSRRQAGDSE
jgi:hypothetical protein